MRIKGWSKTETALRDRLHRRNQLIVDLYSHIKAHATINECSTCQTLLEEIDEAIKE